MTCKLYRSGRKGEHDDHKQQRAAGANPPQSLAGRRAVGLSEEGLDVGSGGPQPRRTAMFLILGIFGRPLLLCAGGSGRTWRERPRCLFSLVQRCGEQPPRGESGRQACRRGRLREAQLCLLFPRRKFLVGRRGERELH